MRSRVRESSSEILAPTRYEYSESRPRYGGAARPSAIQTAWFLTEIPRRHRRVHHPTRWRTRGITHWSIRVQVALASSCVSKPACTLPSSRPFVTSVTGARLGLARLVFSPSGRRSAAVSLYPWLVDQRDETGRHACARTTHIRRFPDFALPQARDNWRGSGASLLWLMAGSGFFYGVWAMVWQDGHLDREASPHGLAVSAAAPTRALLPQEVCARDGT